MVGTAAPDTKARQAAVDRLGLMTPVLKRVFLDFWSRELGGFHSVTVAHARLIKPAEIKAIGKEFRLN